jgi:hypothetical protein
MMMMSAFHQQQQSHCVSFQAASSYVCVSVCVCRSKSYSCKRDSKATHKMHLKKCNVCWLLLLPLAVAAAFFFFAKYLTGTKKAQSPLFFLQFYCISFVLKRMNE